MIKYLRFRGQIYHHELKQMLSSIGYLLTFLMLILKLAIPALFLVALMSLSVIADINTPIDQRIIYQWVYFTLLYFLIRVQKNAILGNNYQHYLASLPSSTKIKNASTMLLTIVAGNLPLLTPVVLLLGISDGMTFFSQLHFPIFALSALIVAWISIKNTSLPLFSFLLGPLIFFLWVKESNLTAISLNSIWLLLLVVEAYFEPLFFHHKLTIKVQYYLQIRWIAMMKNPANILSRIFFCSLFIGLIAYVQNAMEQDANGYIQVLSCWVIAILIGSFQFDNEKFYLHYPHYLCSLLNQFRIRYCLDTLPAMFLSLIICSVLKTGLNFYIENILLLPLGVYITIMSVSKFNRTFFILPSVFYGLMMFTI
ncbi:MAG: DUF6136 family protein [Colwellia sp.]